ncbi:MAG: hypothetical protein HY234_09130 [Acidobacteria bacterium]|nr:hypothetical protein [Acidobacteriota bacterium]MBI3663197.1 hypothetical protein [Acidobacteriota bacterium]
MPKKKSVKATASFRFAVRPEGARRTEALMRKQVEAAVQEAVLEMRQQEEGFRAQAEPQGGLLGLGAEWGWVLTTVITLGDVAAKAALGGTAAAAGKLFMEKYLYPKLRKLNLLPGQVTESKAQVTPRNKKVKAKK